MLIRNDRYDLTDTFEVTVGIAPSYKSFTVYTEVLIKRSYFFRAARSPPWLKDPTKPTKLIDTKPELFSLYLNCLFFGINSLQQYDDASDSKVISSTGKQLASDRRDLASDRFELLIELYVLAEELIDPRTANEVVDEFIRFSDDSQRFPEEHHIVKAYELTGKEDPLRKLMRDYFVYEEGYEMSDRPQSQPMPQDFYRDVAEEFWHVKEHHFPDQYNVFDSKVNVLLKENPCRYHQHNENHPWCVE